MKALLVAVAVAAALSGCGGGGGGGGAQAAGSTQVVTDVTIGFVAASDVDGVQVAVCPANATAISAGCFCQIPASGPIFGLELVGNGAICGCFPGAGPQFPVTVTVTCSSLVFGNAVAALAGGVEIQPSHTPQADATQQEAWAAQRKAKEEAFEKARR